MLSSIHAGKEQVQIRIIMHRHRLCTSCWSKSFRARIKLTLSESWNQGKVQSLESRITAQPAASVILQNCKHQVKLHFIGS